MTEEIYKVHGKIKDFIDFKVDMETGELVQIDTPDYIIGDLDALAMNKATKQENMIKYHKVLDGKVSVIDDEIKRLKRLKEVTQNKQKSIKWLLQQMMLSDDVKKLDFDTCSVIRRKNPGRLEVDELELPASYTKEVVERVIDKKMIKEALKNGETIAGAKIIPGESLIIK